MINDKNIKMKKVIKWVFGAILIILIIQTVFVVVPYTISTFNEQKDIRNSYNQKVQEKEVIMNEFTSCLTSSLNISNTNAEYFKENIQIIMDNRQDGMGLMWKWVREINPNANYKEVADLFKNMQQMYCEKRDIIIKANADIFMLQKRDKDLIIKFPSSVVIKVFGETTPIK